VSNEVLRHHNPFYQKTHSQLTNQFKELNKVIQEAYDGSTAENYIFWLADNFATAPRRTQEGDATYVNSATEPPIPKDWVSPFKGKTAEDAAAFLKTAPEDLSVDWHHFAVLGEDFEKRRLVTLYRIGDMDLAGGKLEKLLCSVAGSTLALSSMEKHVWEEWGNDFGEDEPIGY
jgi:hypothetical protein